MDGQCQDEFLHGADPGREQERINVTFRWVKQHVLVMGNSGNGVFGLFGFSSVSCVLGRC